jgi:hypothetical protein
MTKRERAAHAAKWRKIAKAYEKNVRDPRTNDGVGLSWSGLCSALAEVSGEYPDKDFPNATSRPLFLFRGTACDWWWPCDREGDDCRVIAAGLIAAMYETGEFDV